MEFSPKEWSIFILISRGTTAPDRLPKLIKHKNSRQNDENRKQQTKCWLKVENNTDNEECMKPPGNA